MDRELHQHASSLIRGAVTPASQLRELINQIEINLGRIQISDSVELQNLPILFDQTAALLDSLEEGGANIASEYTRFDTVCATYRKNGAQYIKALGGRTAYINMREQHSPEKDHWWWFLDKYLDDQMRIRQKKTMRSFLTTIGIIGALVLLYVVFLAPDKETREVIRHQSDAESALVEGTPAVALEFLEQALAIRPEDDRLLILYGVAAKLSDNNDIAEESFSKALTVMGDEVDFLSLRAQVYLAAGMPESALQNAEQAIEINHEIALPHYYKGLAANALGDSQTAYLELEAAANYAHQEGKIELEGMARIQMAYLTQNFGFPQSTATPSE